MLVVRNKGQTEGLLHVDGSLEVYEEINGPFTLAATVPKMAENIGFNLVEGHVVITWEGYDFRIRQLSKTDYAKSFSAISTYFDNKGERKDHTFGGTKKLNEFLDETLAGTGWTYENIGITESVFIPNFGNDNVLKLVEILLIAFDCQRKIMPGNHLIFQKKIGPDRDAQYHYGNNIKTISYSYDDTDVFTSIKGYGGGGLEVTYTSPNASKYPNAGEAEPFRDERFTIPASLVEQLKIELKDEADIAIEVESQELDEKELGERVWLIHEEMELGFQSQVLAKTTREPKERSSTVIGNALPKSRGDQLAEQNVKIDENAKQTNSKFDQTNEQFAFEVERLDGDITEAKTDFDITADGITADILALRNYTDDEFGLVKEEASTNVSMLAGHITAAMSTSKEYTDDLIGDIRQENSTNINLLSGRINAKAESTTVTALGTRMNNVEFDMNAVEGEVSTKVSSTDYTGQQIISKVSQTSSLYKIQAKNIEFRGAVTVLSELSDDLGTIRAGNIDISEDIRVGNDIYLGNPSAVATTKRLIFHNRASITGTDWGTDTHVDINADRLQLNGTDLYMEYLRNIYAPKLVQSDGFNPVQIELAYSAAANRVYWDINGVRKGYVQLLTT